MDWLAYAVEAGVTLRVCPGSTLRQGDPFEAAFSQCVEVTTGGRVRRKLQIAFSSRSFI